MPNQEIFIGSTDQKDKNKNSWLKPADKPEINGLSEACMNSLHAVNYSLQNCKWPYGASDFRNLLLLLTCATFETYLQCHALSMKEIQCNICQPSPTKSYELRAISKWQFLIRRKLNDVILTLMHHWAHPRMSKPVESLIKYYNSIQCHYQRGFTLKNPCYQH